MKKALVTLLKYVVFLGLGIWITYHMLAELSDKQRLELVEAIKSINPYYLLPIGIAGFLSHYFRAVRWRYLLATIDLHPTKMNTFFAVMIGYITNLAIPRAGEVAKCTVLAKYEKMPAHKMVGTIVAERAFDILCLLVIALGAFVLQFRTINDYIGHKLGRLSQKILNHEYMLLFSGLLILTGIVLLVMLYRRNRHSKGGKLMQEMTHGIMSIVHMKQKWQFMGYTFLMWLMYVLQLFIGLKSLTATHVMSFLASLVVLVYGSVGLIVTPGGIGAYPYLVTQILSGPYDVPDVPAQAFGWIAWAVQTVVILVLGVISLLFIHTYNNRRNAKTAMDSK